MDELDPRFGNSNRSAFWPLLIIAFSTTAWGAFQAYQLVQENDALKKLSANQESLMQNAAKLRTQLDSIAGDTQRLANAGNANAQAIVTELRRRGITINPDVKPAGADAEGKK